MNEFSTRDVGKFGENVCAKYIKKVKKLKILGRNVTVGHLEADIVAYDKDYIVIIEVKTRRADKNNIYRPADAVNYEKRTNLIKFAYTFCQTLPLKHRKKSLRIDVCEVMCVAEKKLKVTSLNYIEDAVSR